MGQIYLFQRQHAKAIAEGKQAISLDPNFSIGHALLAQIMFFTGLFAEAIELTRKAMRLSPYYPAFYLNYLGRSYAFMGHRLEAIATCNQLYDRSLRGEYLSDWGLLYLAMVYAEFGREDEARIFMAQALKINPGLSLEYFKQGQPFKNPAHMKRELAALKKAGLK
jgi:tetratricopeptide (TPR) repeat protein